MTDADDEGLIKELRNPVYEPRRGHFLDGARLHIPSTFEAMQKAADRIEAQGKEIAELRAVRSGMVASWNHINNEIMEMRAVLSEALKVIAPFAETAEYLEHNLGNLDFFPKSHSVPCSLSAVRAAAAFAKKHGGKDD